MTYLISLTLFAALPGALGFLGCPGDSASFIPNVTNAFEEAQIVPDVLTSFDPSAILNVTFPVSGILPGELVPLSETSNEPQFSLCGNDAALANQTFVLAMVDPDARTNVSVAQGRHFLGGGFVFRNDHSNKLVNTTPALSDYIGPEPLAGQSPHRYVIVAYIQPPNFEKIAPSFVNESTSRLYFNLSSFEEEVHLGNPIAGNFFYAANTTLTTTVYPQDVFVLYINERNTVKHFDYQFGPNGKIQLVPDYCSFASSESNLHSTVLFISCLLCATVNTVKQTLPTPTMAFRPAAKLPPGANRILFVKNLNYSITGDDLYDLFGRYGSIRQLRIGNEPKTKGTAFVVFEDVMDAKNALDHLNGFHLQERYIVVLYHMPAKQDAAAQKADIAKREEELAQLKKKHGIGDEL